MELQPILHRHVIRVTTHQETVLLTQLSLEGEGGLRLVEDVLERIAHYGFQRLGNRFPVGVHTHRVRLHHGSVAIDVNNQSWQIVPLAMHKAIGVVVLTRHTDAISHVLCNGKFPLVETLVNLFILKRQHPYHDAAYLVMSSRDVFVFARVHRHCLSLYGLLAHVVDGS